MSLTKTGMRELIKKQYAFKLRAYSGFFTTLIILQVIGMLFSLGGVGSSGSSSSGVSVTITYFSANQLIGFTLIWIFISAVLMTTSGYRENDFTFVTNRLSNHLANGLFLLTASIIGGITAYLGGFIVKLIIRLFDTSYLVGTGLPSTWLELISGVIGVIFMLLLLALLGYLVGTLVQLHAVFIVVLPAVLIGFLSLTNRFGGESLALKLFGFYFQESSIIIFSVKVITTSILLLIIAIKLSNRQEVRFS